MADGIPGQEIGYAEVTSSTGLVGFPLTTSEASVSGLFVPVTIPTNCRIHIEAFLPLVINNATANNINVSIIEDSTFVAFGKQAMGSAEDISIKVERTIDARPGNHNYWVTASVTGGTATTYGGLASPYIFAEYIRVVVC